MYVSIVSAKFHINDRPELLGELFDVGQHFLAKEVKHSLVVYGNAFGEGLLLVFAFAYACKGEPLIIGHLWTLVDSGKFICDFINDFLLGLC
jgi:hypothetical protein